jgi:hypothetical protein
VTGFLDVTITVVIGGVRKLRMVDTGADKVAGGTVECGGLTALVVTEYPAPISRVLLCGATGTVEYKRDPEEVSLTGVGIQVTGGVHSGVVV